MEEIVHPPLKSREAEERWSVVVLYEDKATRDRAMSLCDRLVRNFWSEVEFDFHWWRTDFLNDPRMAETAATDATDSDVFIFSSATESELSPVFKSWFEDWSARRESREGMFLDLADMEAQNDPRVQVKQARLKAIVARANLEYFNRIPPPLSGALFNSWQSVEARATGFTTTLDDILRRLPPPTHFGLNE